MKQVSEMPTSGQFVAVWQRNNKIYTHQVRWSSDGALLFASYDEFDEEVNPEFYISNSAQYIVAD